jgi:hypothetical protein
VKLTPAGKASASGKLTLVKDATKIGHHGKTVTAKLGLTVAKSLRATRSRSTSPRPTVTASARSRPPRAPSASTRKSLRHRRGGFAPPRHAGLRRRQRPDPRNGPPRTAPPQGDPGSHTRGHRFDGASGVQDDARVREKRVRGPHCRDALLGRPPSAPIDRAQTPASPWRSSRKRRPAQRRWHSSIASAAGHRGRSAGIRKGLGYLRQHPVLRVEEPGRAPWVCARRLGVAS